MPLYSQESLLRLRERVDLVEVLSRHVELKRAGASFKGLCPFHEEKTPSFIVRRGDRHYHCFGCGAHGDAIEFLMQHLHLSFGEAVEQLAELFHIHLETVEKAAPVGPDKGKIKEALAMANAFFHYVLVQHKEGKSALQYLASRQIGMPFIERFGLGYAPAAPGAVGQALAKKGFSEEIMQAAGLITPEGRGFFRERITFPIHNPLGAVVGFSARKFHEDTFGGKYINSPDTLLFKKSKILFGLNFSRRQIAKERRAIVVEGQIDCLRLIEAGWDTTVAALGTAFTEEHVQELKQLGALQAILLFDGDKSGRQAASKVGHLFQKQGIDTKVALLPQGMDPDTLICRQGKEALQRLVLEAPDYLTFQFSHLAEQYDPGQPGHKAQLVRLLGGQIGQWQDPVMVHESLKRLSRLSALPEALILANAPLPHEKQQEMLKPRRSVEPKRRQGSLECDLLRWLLFGEDDDLIGLIGRNMVPEDFEQQDCRVLFEAFFRMVHKGYAKEDRIALLAEVGQVETVEGLMEELAAKKINKAEGKELCLRTIQQLLDRRWLQKREAIQQEIARPGQGEEELLALVKAFDQLKNERPQIK